MTDFAVERAPDATGDPETKAADSEKLRDIHDRAMRRFDSVSMPQAELRAQSIAARRFVEIPGAMWEDKWGYLFENTPRPEIDKITTALEKIETDYRLNRLTVDFIPSGSTGDDITADTLDGMHRADSYRAKAQQARDNAFMEAIRGGFGAYRLGTDYEDELDPDNEAMRVIPGMTIVDADQSVYFDGASKLYDKADAEWAFVVTADPRETIKERWGEDALPDWPMVTFRYRYDWFQPDVVRVAEYYEIERVPDIRVTLTQEQSGEEQRFFESDVDEDEVKALVAQGWKKKTRKVTRKRVHKYIMHGERVLKDCGYIAGDRIPIVPVYGKRSFVDNMERWRGHVQKFMDRQRIYNAQVAKLAETASLSPREVPIVAPEQVTQSIADEWAKSNVERHPFLRLLPLRNEAGDIISAGPIGKVEPPQVPQVAAALLQIASADLQEQDDSAQQVKANVSADAMDIAAGRVDAKSGIYLDNMRQSVALEGEIYLGMARDVYWEPGRKVETLSLDGKDDVSELHKMDVTPDGVYRIVNDLQRGNYKVVADVQEATATLQQRTVRQCVSAAEMAVQAGDTELAQAYLITAGMNQDGEGLQDLKAWLRNKAIGLGLAKPSPEEQKVLEAQSQEQKQPSPADMALQAQTQALGAKAALDNASAQDKMASAALKTAQAEAVGGPAEEPATPTGLHQVVGDVAKTADTLASARLKNAQADHLHNEMGLKRIKTGHEIAMDQAGMGQAA